MRVALDVTAAATGSTGVARYVNELRRTLASQVEVVPFAFGRAVDVAGGDVSQWRLPLRLLHRSWPVVAWPRVETLVGCVDVVHVPDLLPPPLRAPLVMTVHDLAALEHPDLHPARRVQAQRRQLAAAHRAAVVLAVSEVTAQALRHRGIDPDRVMVAYSGATQLPAPAPRRVEPPYLLAVGEVTARKGLPLLLDAFHHARLPPSWRLVLAGPDGPEADTLLGEVGSRVVRLGRVTDAELSRLYDDALALCFPSVAEGFGLPLVEAMSAGLPVLAHDLPIVQEVTAGAAVLVPLGDAAAWRDALERCAFDPDLLGRCAAAGRRRAALFTWEETARTTVEAYRRAVACG